MRWSATPRPRWACWMAMSWTGRWPRLATCWGWWPAKTSPRARAEDGVFRIVRGVARDRLISTVDVQARHGHKSRARTFDGYKSHFAIDPEDELITAVALTPANTPDRDVVDELLGQPSPGATTAVPDDSAVDSGDDGQGRPGAKDIEVYGDSAYAGGATLEEQAARGRDMRTKVPPARNPE